MLMRSILVFDTTLHDGEKAPGTILTVPEKFRIAKALERLRVDVLEAGFPAASEEQFQIVERVAREVREVRVAALARATHPKDFEVAWEALRAAEQPRLHTFVPISPYYRSHFLNKDIDALVELAGAAVSLAAGHTSDVEFSLVDALRADPDEVARVAEAAIQAGARTINIADTVGYATPREITALFEHLQNRVASFDKALFSIHCHNDLGLAVANSLAAVGAGAGQVHCTVNGIGERAGNAALEEIVVALAARGTHYQAETGVQLKHICPASRLVRRLTGNTLQPNKPVVGSNAFLFDPLVPQLADAVGPPPYRFIEPKELGCDEDGDALAAAASLDQFSERAAELGYPLDQTGLEAGYQRFLELAEERELVADSDLELLLNDHVDPNLGRYRLRYLNVSAGSIAVPNATVQLEVDGVNLQDAGFGRGPVDAAFKTIFKMVNRSPKLVRYEVSAVTAGTEAQGEVCVRLEDQGCMVQGRAVDTDVVLASAKALVDGLNKLEYMQGRRPVSEFTDEDGWLPEL